MKIKEVTSERILFDNGNAITFEHDRDCCEENYADFMILTENNVNYGFDFNEELAFEFIDEMGFRFGSKDSYGVTHWIFIPCYSDQNGYYSNDIDILYNGNQVLNGFCEEHVY